MSRSASPPPTQHDDRREYERIPARVEVRFKAREEAAKAFRAFSLNVSAGGLCFRTTRQYEKGAALELALQIENEVHELKAAVAWVRDGVVGVRFVEVSDQTRTSLLGVIQTLKARLGDDDDR